MFIFKSYKDLVQATNALLPKIPRDIKTVIGVARSGMVPATIIATQTGTQLGMLTELGVLEIASGRTTTEYFVANKAGTVLLVDDSIGSGLSLQNAKEMLGMKCVTCAIYALQDSASKVDIYGEIVPFARIFEWNLWRKDHNSTFMDLDGVICADPVAYDDDGDLYEKSIINAAPLYLPETNIKAIVTNRIARWRPQTEAWLDRYHVKYDQLVMQDFPTAVQRRKCSNPALFKAKHYSEDKTAALFIESNSAQAKIIAVKSGKPVLSIEEMRLYGN